MIKASLKFLGIFTCIILTASLGKSLLAQSIPDKAGPVNLETTILKHDALFWEAYNNCDTDQLRTFFTADLEFYHDLTGLSTPLTSFMKTIEGGICRSDEWGIRREAVEGSIGIYPLNSYGAIITGEHLFYVKEKDKNERLEGKAKFFHLWQFSEDNWKMSRAVSYDHAPAHQQTQKEQIQLSEEVLRQYAGNYRSAQSGMAIVTNQEEHLNLKSGGFQAIIYPESADTFFIKEGALQFKFYRDSKGQVTKLIILENGAPVDEAERVD